MGFRKTTQNSGLYSCQLEKLIVCLYVPGKEGRPKKSPVARCLVVIRATKEMNEIWLSVLLVVF